MGAELNSCNQHILWILEGFAHGFIALEDNTHFLYKTIDYYVKDCERAIRWDDRDLAIQWPESIRFNISEKDKEALPFRSTVKEDL
nr:dTDP-4-dehydrorhamnose 3,5-epimerase family protein [Oceanisphaera sp. IT1-181]